MSLRIFYYPSLRDEETVIQRPYFCCQGSHTHGMEKLSFKPKARNFKSCFLSTGLPCTEHCNCLLPTDIINHRTEENLGITGEEKPYYHGSTCVSFPGFSLVFLPVVCSTCLAFI